MDNERFVPVEGSSSLVRDKSTGAIVNINKKEMQAARLRKEQKQKQQQEIDQLKTDVSDIKQMLQQIVEKI